MISILRGIRRELSDEKEFKGYFKYALGEILLVVIGILIALQINNWNEERKLSDSEVQYYRNLKRQLEEDSKIIFNNVDFNDRYREQYRYAIERLKNNDRSNLDTLGIIAINLLEYSDFHQQRNIYESLLISGEIELLHNKKIIEGLQALDESYVYINKLEETHFEVVKLIYTDLKKIVRMDPLHVENPDALFGFEFQNHFILSLDITSEKEEIYSRTIRIINSILELLDEEINN